MTEDQKIKSIEMNPIVMDMKISNLPSWAYGYMTVQLCKNNVLADVFKEYCEIHYSLPAY